MGWVTHRGPCQPLPCWDSGILSLLLHPENGSAASSTVALPALLVGHGRSEGTRALGTGRRARGPPSYTPSEETSPGEATTSGQHLGIPTQPAERRASRPGSWRLLGGRRAGRSDPALPWSLPPAGLSTAGLGRSLGPGRVLTRLPAAWPRRVLRTAPCPSALSPSGHRLVSQSPWLEEKMG